MDFCAIIIPIYNPNKERFIDLLQSLNQQIDKDFKIYFINDNSNNNDFKSLIQNYLQSNIHYEIVDLDQNIGQGLARQKGIDISKEEWVTFVDQDDTVAPTMIKKVKEIINNTKCSFLLTTRSIIADDKDWMNTGLYTVEEGVSVLHGKFYNRKAIDKYNLHFTDKVRAHEDTFFQNLVYSYISLDNELDSTCNVESDLITYIWYLWADSTSHSDIFDKMQLGNHSYLESSINEYIIATIEAYKEVISKYPPTMEFKYSKLCSFLYFLYWFEQAFEYFNPLGWKKENLIYVKQARDFVMKEFGMKKVEEITNLLLDVPDIYNFTYNQIYTNVDGYFVPRLTIEQFYLSLEQRINEF